MTENNLNPDNQLEPPTLRWQATAFLPSLPEEHDRVAERLVLLAHYGADFSIWGEKRRIRYWDALAERVKAATFAGPSLTDWWNRISKDLPTSPRNHEERKDLLELLSHEEQRKTLKTLREHAEVLVLRVRVIAETRRQDREQKPL